MRREDLMKPDTLSKILLLSSSIVIMAALVTLLVLALARAASAYNFAITDLQRSADTLLVRLAL
jgi:hypothetical protein